MVWAEKNTVPPAIEIKVIDQTQEDSVLDGAEGDEKKAQSLRQNILKYRRVM
jgi:hypothetical protein